MIRPAAHALPGQRTRHRRRRLLRHLRRPRPRDPLRFGDHRRPCGSSGSRFAPASTRASASSWTGRSRESRSISGRESQRRRRRSQALVSSTVKDLVAGSGIQFEDRGAAELKGIPGHWQLYAVQGRLVDAPETRYARSGDVWIAYQAFGDGPPTSPSAPGYVSNIELGWSIPGRAAFLEELASFARVIQFDKRGTGMSDPGPRARLARDADGRRSGGDGRGAGSERAALFGIDHRRNDEHRLRSDLSGAHGGPDPQRDGGADPVGAGSPVGPVGSRVPPLGRGGGAPLGKRRATASR